jgi:hypothetical protein
MGIGVPDWLRSAAAGKHKNEVKPSASKPFKVNDLIPDWLESAAAGKNKHNTSERAETVSTPRASSGWKPSGRSLTPAQLARKERMTDAAKRRTNNKDAHRAAAKAAPKEYYAARSADKSVQADRQKRIGMHQFKGKYWGPEEFKGDQKKIDAWKAAGKPKDRAAFAKAYKK